MNLWQRIAYWVLAPAFSLMLYWKGLTSWFREDDFAWLGLSLSIQEPYDLWAALFSPMAQGTIRPLSERLYFLVLHHLFDFDALPFHIVVFLTQFLAIWLLQAITRRLTGSYFAAVVASLLWTANSSLARPMSWASSYNQIQCSAFLLSAFLCFLRYTETGQRKWWYLQWLVFLLGFGALELNVVYPALVATWAILFRRSLLPKILPLFLVSILYTIVHRSFAPAETAELYRMYWDTGMLKTIARYWVRAFGAFEGGLTPEWTMWSNISTAISSVSLAAFLGWQCYKRQWLALFCIAWFLGILAPVLPLKFHVTAYYLVMPTLGLAIAAGWACQLAWNSGTLYRAIAAFATIAYLAGSGYMTYFVAGYNYQQTRIARQLFFGVQQASQLHPDKILLLAGVSSEQFWSLMSDGAFRLLPGPPEVYLTPDAAGNIDKHPEINDIAPFVLPSTAAKRALSAGAALVYQPQGDKLKNVTVLYQALSDKLWPIEPPQRIDVGQKYQAEFIGAGWHPVEANKLRWMSKRAEVRLGAPNPEAKQLVVTCFRFADDPRSGPLTLTVTANGQPLAPQPIPAGEAEHHLVYRIPNGGFKEKEITIVLELDQVFSYKDDTRPMGLVLGNLAWK